MEIDAPSRALSPAVSGRPARVATGSVPRVEAPSAAHTAPALKATWARSGEDVRAAQRLRWRVFADELGARLQPPAGTPSGHDADLFDDHCEHLLVQTVATDESPSKVVGTYRVLTPDAARRTGGLYTDTEFDLQRLNALRPTMAELGRSCTDPAYRSGGVILMLWSSLAQFMQRNGLQVMVGCASVPMADGGHAAASLWQRLRETHLAPDAMRVTPRLPLPVDALDADVDAPTPPLIKGYLACGAQVLGAPAWDPDFGCADLPMMLRLDQIPAAYRRRFMASVPA
jgi:putative hemolysin